MFLGKKTPEVVFANSLRFEGRDTQEIRALESVCVSTWMKKLGFKIEQQIKKKKTCLIYIEHETGGMGVMGHSHAHGLEQASVTHHYYIAGRITRMGEDGNLTLIGGYQLYYPPTTLGRVFPRVEKEALGSEVLPFYQFVQFLFPETSYKPYRHKETTGIALGDSSVGYRLSKIRKNFGKDVEVNLP